MAKENKRSDKILNCNLIFGLKKPLKNCRVLIKKTFSSDVLFWHVGQCFKGYFKPLNETTNLNKWFFLLIRFH